MNRIILFIQELLTDQNRDMRALKNICLITINGKRNHTSNFIGLRLPPKTTTHFCMKKVRNFITIDLIKLGIFICAYAQGCFKITLSQSINFKNILLKIEFVISKITEILDLLYLPATLSQNIDAKISQIALTVVPEGKLPSKTRLSYQLLTKIFHLNNNEIHITIGTHKLVHIVNWMTYEDCGSSSFYFKIISHNSTNKNKHIAGLKLFNNTKMMVFIHDMSKTEEIIATADCLQTRIIFLCNLEKKWG